MGSVNWNYLPCKGRVIIVSGVHFWEASCVMKEVGKPWGKVLPAIFLMSFECWPRFSPLLEWFDYAIRKSAKKGKCRICKQGRCSVTIKWWIKRITSCKSFNPLNPRIKIWILICCPYSFPKEVVGRSW